MIIGNKTANFQRLCSQKTVFILHLLAFLVFHVFRPQLQHFPLLLILLLLPRPSYMMIFPSPASSRGRSSFTRASTLMLFPDPGLALGHVSPSLHPHSLFHPRPSSSCRQELEQLSLKSPSQEKDSPPSLFFGQRVIYFIFIIVASFSPRPYFSQEKTKKKGRIT